MIVRNTRRKASGSSSRFQGGGGLGTIGKGQNREKVGRRQGQYKDKTGARQGKDRDKISTIGFLKS